MGKHRVVMVEFLYHCDHCNSDWGDGVSGAVTPKNMQYIENLHAPLRHCPICRTPMTSQTKRTYSGGENDG